MNSLYIQCDKVMTIVGMGLLLVLELLNFRGSEGICNLVDSGCANEESFFKHNMIQNDCYWS